MSRSKCTAIHGGDSVTVTTLFAVAGATMSWFAPGLGLALGGLQIGVGINNLRQRKRLQLQLSLYDEVEKGRGV